MYLTYLSSKPKVLEEIIDKYNKLNFKIEGKVTGSDEDVTLDDVITKIDKLYDSGKIAMLRELRNKIN